MNLVKSIRLFYNEGKSDKVYEVDLVELSRSEEQRYLVNFRYGRRGSSLREGTKTPEPVDLEKANKYFDSVVVAKKNKGYLEKGESARTNPTTNQQEKTAFVAKDRSTYRDYLVSQLNSAKTSQARARVIWRIGDLGDERAIRDVISQSTKPERFEAYAQAFAIGRCKAQFASEYLEQLSNSSDKGVRDYALDAQLHVLPDHLKHDLIKQAKRVVNSEFLALLTDNLELDSLVSVLVSHFKHRPEPFDQHNYSLIFLYRLAAIDKLVRHGLLRLLQDLPLRPELFRGVRHIFKVAEMRLDSEMFALLSYRFDKEKHFYSYDYSHAYVPGAGYLDVKKEQKKSQPRVAYSQKTRQYLRRRSWRTLRRIGNVGHKTYVPMAVAQLLRLTDADDRGVSSSSQYHWDAESRSYEVTESLYAPYRDHFTPSKIMYGNSQAYRAGSNGRTWVLRGTELESHQIRTELYPELWDEQANAGIDLLIQSRCHAVHKFAVRLLQDHPETLAGIDLSQLIALLSKSYVETSELAYQTCKQRIEALGYERDLYLAMLQTVSGDARSLVIEHLDRHRSQWKRDTRFVALQLFITHEDVQTWRARAFLDSVSEFGPSDQDKILNEVLSECFDKNTLSGIQYTNIISFLEKQLSTGAKRVSFPIIDRCLSQKSEHIQLLGAQLLFLNEAAFEDIPEALYNKVSNSPYASVRAKAIALLGKQTDQDLLKQPKVILNIYKQGEHLERVEVAPIIVRLAKRSDDFSQATIFELIPLAFQKEKDQTQHADVVALFTQDLREHWDQIDADLLWRLLRAQSKAAQTIGMYVLTEARDRRVTELSVKQWALLTQHPFLQVREHIYSTYDQNIVQIKDNTRDALRIFDSEWLDAREFGQTFFKEKYTDRDWTPELLVFVCDNNRDDVQAFGRELLQRFFKQELGEEYLLKLSQHPSTNVQLFASGFLRDHAGGKPVVITELKQYFITVLSQVNRARVCKDRVFKFLLGEARTDEKVACLVAEIFSRQSVTAVIKDRSTLVESLLELQLQYPNLTMPLLSKPRPIWSRNKQAKRSNEEVV